MIEDEPIVVILDNGHGCNTPGKESPVWPDGSQLHEWEFNRDVVRRIHARLISLSIPSRILIKEALDVSLKTRVSRANAIYAAHPGSFLISIHGNAGGGQGWEAWTSRGETESDKIATLLYTHAKAMLAQFKIRTDYSDGDPDKESDFYILAKTNCPAVLTENLFYDNRKECAFMMSDFGRDLIAKMHVFAIQTYLNLRSDDES